MLHWRDKFPADSRGKDTLIFADFMLRIDNV